MGQLHNTIAAILLSTGAVIPFEARAQLSQMLPAPSGIEEQAWTRFLAAAAPIRTDDGGLILYDFATRCALRPGSLEGQTELSQGQSIASELRLDRLLVEGFENIGALREPSPMSAGSCVASINTSFGNDFTADASRFGALARHAESVLQGAPIDGPDATTSASVIALTQEARDVVAANFVDPVLLATRHEGEKVILILGDPYSSYRWFTQYRAMPDGGFRYEGAYDAPFLR